MTKLSTFTLALGLLISMRCISQVSNEIGIGFTIDNDQRIFLNYQLVLNQNRAMNFRISQGWLNEEDFGGARIFESSSIGESNFESSYITNRTLQTKLTFGPEFRIKESSFCWGVEGILGYRAETSSIRTKTYDVVYDSALPYDVFIVLPANTDVISVFYKSEFLTTGFQGRFSLKAFSTERLGVQVFGEVGMEYNIRFSDKTEYAEEPEPFRDPTQADVVFTFSKNFFIPKFRLGASISLTHK